MSAAGSPGQTKHSYTCSLWNALKPTWFVLFNSSTSLLVGSQVLSHRFDVGSGARPIWWFPLSLSRSPAAFRHTVEEMRGVALCPVS